MTLTPTGRSATRASAPVERAGSPVTLRCPGITLDPGARAILRGRVSDAGPDTRVSLQVKWDGRAWRGEATQRPGSSGAYRFARTIPADAPAGRVYSWRVVVTSGGDVVGVSQTRTSLIR